MYSVEDRTISGVLHIAIGAEDDEQGGWNVSLRLTHSLNSLTHSLTPIYTLLDKKSL